VNDRAFNFQKAMNNKLIRILDRYDLDKPILMSDKLDIIWDKSKATDSAEKRAKETGLNPVTTLNDAKS
jgi:hypothetical protein